MLDCGLVAVNFAGIFEEISRRVAKVNPGSSRESEDLEVYYIETRKQTQVYETLDPIVLYCIVISNDSHLTKHKLRPKHLLSRSPLSKSYLRR